MKSISIAAVEVHNFQSFEEDAIIFPEEPGLIFVAGENQLEPRLGSNGGGKSSVWNAIVWCAFGTSINGKKTSKVLKWGQENVSVTTTLCVDGNLRDVRRSGPPDRIWIDEKAATQGEIEILLGLTRERFLNSIVFGQGQPLFPDLSVAERGQLFDDILELDLWNRASDVAKRRVEEAQATILGHRMQLANVEGQLEALPTQEALQAKIDTFERVRETAINEKLAEAEKQEPYLASVRADLAKILPVSDKEKERQTKADGALAAKLRVQQINLRKSAETAQILTQAQEDMKAIELGKCRLCGQTLPNAQQALYDIRQHIAILEANAFNSTEGARVACEDYAAEQEANRKLFEDVTKRRSDRQQAENRLQFIEREIEHLVKEIEALEKRENPYQNDLVDMEIDRAQLEAARILFNSDIRAAEGQLTIFDYWKTAFKQIRLFYVSEVLGTLEIEINSAINALGLLGWQAKLVTETENKSGTIKLGVQIEITDPRGRVGKWGDFGSGGEDQRLRLPMALGLANLIQRAAGVSWDVEAWDEPTNFLSGQGVSDLMDLLAYRAESQKKIIFLIDHRALTHSGFREQWLVKKSIDGSKILKA